MCVCAAHFGSVRLGRFCRGGKLLPPWNLIIFIIIVIIILLLATFYVYYYFIPIKSCGRSASAPSTVIIFVYFIVVLDPDTNPWTHRRGSWTAGELRSWWATPNPQSFPNCGLRRKIAPTPLPTPAALGNFWFIVMAALRLLLFPLFIHVCCFYRGCSH